MAESTNPSSNDTARPAPVKRRRRSRWRPLLIAIVLLAAGGGALGYFRTASDAEAQAEPVTALAVRGDIEDAVSALGNIQPRDYVDVGAQVSGQLKQIHVVVGQDVPNNFLLAEIDPVVLVARVEGGRAQLASLKAQLVDRQAQATLAGLVFERQGKLRRDKATSEEAYESADAAARSAAAQVDMLKAQISQVESTIRGDEATLGYTKIYAPMAGTVVSLTARKGQTLNTNQQAPIILRIADLSTMTIWTQVSEADVSRLKLGMKAYFNTLGTPQRRWTGRLRQIMPTPEVVNNVVLYTALFDVANPKQELMTQMTAQVYFVVGEAHDVVTVPFSAVKRSGRERKATVDVVGEDGAIETRPVEVGVTNRVLAEIRSGITPGERVVIGNRAAEPRTAQGNRPGGSPGLPRMRF
ncbi:efflux RND transporter periplasmic adaptor subunit [Chelatococcus asaccharovorans]|uniref:Macrolide-specific efflux system membrane fusion protein n=1 Tax=Chelatococcus asaccharovorans TaxID=28210 RepID=A0A2V3UBU6_9HYPH|nr:efflux RND transporter periplasmic adaptor subunit [Chelatococcus asaccharovorans]MBS7705319.1 efflux RND transporter periplasmic adaptor subunit [Chelatococcus asaccharovorans]PXW60278.1 macrolide-specific efflux system membrane fusion protein [Chelatococcus asaccharovorans]